MYSFIPLFFITFYFFFVMPISAIDKHNYLQISCSSEYLKEQLHFKGHAFKNIKETKK